MERSVGGASSGRRGGQARAGKTPAAATPPLKPELISMHPRKLRSAILTLSSPRRSHRALNVTAFHLNLLPDNTRLQEASPRTTTETDKQPFPPLPHGQLPYSTGSPGPSPAPSTISSGHDLMNGNGSNCGKPSELQ